MRSRIAGLAIALAMVLAMVATTPPTGKAANPFEVYFPWVPNGTVIDDPRGFDSLGPFFGSITVQNPANITIVVQHTSVATGELDEVILDAYESTTLDANTLGVPAGGGAVTLRGESLLSQQPVLVAAVLKQAAAEPLSPTAQTSEDHVTVGGYTGLKEQDLNNEIVLPIAQTNNNWNTLIRVTNFHPVVHSQTHLWLQEAGGGETLGPYVEHTPPGQTTTFDLLDLEVPEGWVGSAVIGSGTLGAVAERVKNETSMLVMNTSQSVLLPDGEQYAPLIFRDWFHWNTGISVANLAAVENDVTVRYYAPDGEEVHSDNLTIPANGMDFLYLPSGAGDDAFVGSAIVEASEPFVGAVDEVKYLGEDDDTGHAMSYMVEDGAVAGGGELLMLPLYQRGDEQQGTGDTTGIQIFNPTDDPVEIMARVFGQNGFQVLASIDTIDGKHGHTIYAFDDFNALAPGFVGSVLIGVMSAEGAIVGVSNNVNYAVQYDGSASFNLTLVGP